MPSGKVHRTDLTDMMKKRLKEANAIHLEQGDPNDDTRLIDSWKEATEEEKSKLKALFEADPKEYKVAANVKNKSYEVFGVFTNRILSQAIQNLKQSSKRQQEKVQETREEQKEGPMKTGVKAKSNSTVAGASVKSVSAATFNGNQYHYDGTVVGSKKGKGGSKSVRSVSAATFNGVQQTGFDSTKKAIQLTPQLQQVIQSSVGGGLIFGQADVYLDAQRNRRGTLHLLISPMAIIPENGPNIRTSKMDPSVVIAQVELHKSYFHPDKVLKYVLGRMEEACPQLESKEARLSYLRNTARYGALVGNIKMLFQAFEESDRVLFEFRIGFKDENGRPLRIHQELVQEREDNLFFGCHAETDKRGVYRLHMEFKCTTLKAGKLSSVVNSKIMRLN